MVDLFNLFPKELKQTAVAREQYALALNRLAENEAGSGNVDRAEELRKSALATLDEIPAESVTSETFGIRGRIYKGSHDTLCEAANNTESPRSRAMLTKAIETYEQGFRTDLRDYYPGVNAVTLRLLRNSEEDRTVLKSLVSVVRFSVSVAPPPKNEVEKYWQTATKLELASADNDWDSVDKHVTDLLAIDAKGWMHETTQKNLRLQQKAFAKNGDAVAQIESIVAAL
jgi:hypothetical protein